MAKRASKSPGSAAPPTSDRSRAPATASDASTATAGRMVLRAKSSEKMKRLAEITKESDEDRRTKLLKTSKGSHNKKKTNNKLDSMKPKKPPTAFFYFLEDFRKEFQEQNPDIKSMRDIGKACGAKWKTMTYDEKVQYYDIAAEKRREFDQAMEAYMKKQESGEDLESEAETESDE